MKSGIYLITCRPPGRLPHYYVGQAQDLRRRTAQHRQLLRRGRHHNPLLQGLFSKYGESTFSVEVLETCNVECLDNCESWWLSEMIGRDRCCNIGTDPVAPNRGRRFSDSHRNRIAAAISGSNHYLFGARMPAEIRSKISASGRGLKRSDETRRRISAATSGANNPMHGRSGSKSARSRQVAGKCLSTGAILFYESACLAEADGFSQESISRCCNGKQKSHLGFTWEFTRKESS